MRWGTPSEARLIYQIHKHDEVDVAYICMSTIE